MQKQQFVLISISGKHLHKKSPKEIILFLLFISLGLCSLLTILVLNSFRYPYSSAAVEFREELREIEENRNPREESHYSLREAWKYLSPEVYEDLGIDERIALAEVLVDFEAEQLGIPSVNLTIMDLDEGTWGYYSDLTRTVVISTDALEQDDPRVLVEVAAHEVFHSYEHYCVNSIDFSEPVIQNTPYFYQLRKWKENIANYRSMSAGYSKDQYFLQPIEGAAYGYMWEEADRILMHVHDVERMNQSSD